MFGLGFWEIVMVGVLMLVITKPEDLPKVFREIGKIYGQFQRIYHVVIDEFNSVADIDLRKKK